MILSGAQVAVCIDLGGTTLRLGVLDAEYAPGAPIPEMQKVPSETLGDAPVSVLSDLIGAAVPPGHTLAAAVVGLPTMFDAGTRVVQSSPNLPALVGLDVGAELTSALSVPAVVDRETVVMTHGEIVAGAARAYRSVLGVFIGTGIGGAWLVDGVPYRGSSGASIEIGHIPVATHGRTCVCGNIDCLEAYASGHVLNKLAEDAGVPVDAIFSTPALDREIEAYLTALSHGLAAVANTIDPELLMVGGGLARRPEFPLKRLMALTRSHLRAPAPREMLAIEAAALGSRAIIPGAYHLLGRI